MKKSLVLMGLLALAALSAAQTPEQAVKAAYPKYHQGLQCRIAMMKEAGAYCMRPQAAKEVEVAGKRYLYQLFGGKWVNLETESEESIHVASGLSGLFVYEQEKSGAWKLLAANPYFYAGTWGAAPEEWTFLQFGPQQWGFAAEESDVHQGYANSQYTLAFLNGRKVVVNYIPSGQDNSGALGDCSHLESKRERRACLSRLSTLEGELQMMPKLGSNGIWPLRMTINGFVGKKQFRNQTYDMLFNAAKQAYLVPKTYPVAE